MDIYHKILVRIFELTGGDEKIYIDMVDLLKKEGYYPSIDDIVDRLRSESWVTESRTNTVNITHWGVAEAKKVGTVRPDAARTVERESKSLLAETREFAVVIEEFIADPSDERRKALNKKFTDLESIVTKLRNA